MQFITVFSKMTNKAVCGDAWGILGGVGGGRQGRGGGGRGALRLFLGKHASSAPLKNHPHWVVSKLKNHTPFWMRDYEKRHKKCAVWCCLKPITRSGSFSRTTRYRRPYTNYRIWTFFKHSATLKGFHFSLFAFTDRVKVGKIIWSDSAAHLFDSFQLFIFLH